MSVTWSKSYEECEGNITIVGNHTSSNSEFNDYVQTELKIEIKYYLGDTNLEELISNLNETGFETSVLEATLTSSPSLTSWEWGECFAYDLLIKHLGISIPWLPFWDKRIKKASLPGADIVGLKYNGENVIFVFGEIKTSSQSKHPPDVMTKTNDGMIDQIRKLSSRETINYHIQWLLLRAEGRDWKEDFVKAIKYYIQYSIGYMLIGILIRDTSPNVDDLRCVIENLRSLEITTSCHSYYLPININTCMEICSNRGGRDVPS